MTYNIKLLLILKSNLEENLVYDYFIISFPWPYVSIYFYKSLRICILWYLTLGIGTTQNTVVN